MLKFIYLFPSFVLKRPPFSRCRPENGIHNVALIVTCCICRFQTNTSDFSSRAMSHTHYLRYGTDNELHAHLSLPPPPQYALPITRTHNSKCMRRSWVLAHYPTLTYLFIVPNMCWQTCKATHRFHTQRVIRMLCQSHADTESQL